VQSFRNLKVWEKAHALALSVYALTKGFPREELYGLTAQMRRASVSIGCNIAEGCCRKGGSEMGRFLQMALGSASELEYQFVLARDLALLNAVDYERLAHGVTEVKKMLVALIQRVRADRVGLKADS